jgi:hypothetical protein
MRTNLAVSLVLLGLLSVGTVMGTESHKTLPSQRDIKKGAFGSLEITEIYEASENERASVLKTVYPSRKDFVRDYER